MTNSYYLKQPMSMFEIRIGQIIAKNPRLTYRLNRFSNIPLIRKYKHQVIKFVKERN